MNSFCFSRKHFAVSRWFAWQTTSSKTYRYFSKTDLEGESGWQFLGDSTTRKATFHSISSRSKTDPKHEIYNTRNPHTTTTKTNKKRQISHRTTNLNHKEANSEQHRRPTGPARGIPYHEARKQKTPSSTSGADHRNDGTMHHIPMRTRSVNGMQAGQEGAILPRRQRAFCASSIFHPRRACV